MKLISYKFKFISKMQHLFYSLLAFYFLHRQKSLK